MVCQGKDGRGSNEGGGRGRNQRTEHGDVNSGRSNRPGRFASVGNSVVVPGGYLPLSSSRDIGHIGKVNDCAHVADRCS